MLDYEKLKRWARWIVGREVFDKIIFGMTDTSDRLHNWFDSSWNKIEQLKKHAERRDLAAGVYYIRKNDKIIKHYSWKCGKDFPEIKFLLYSERVSFIQLERIIITNTAKKVGKQKKKHFIMLMLRPLCFQ